jgi:hypothetical protein
MQPVASIATLAAVNDLRIFDIPCGNAARQ